VVDGHGQAPSNRPLSPERIQALLAKTAPYANDGKFERFKTSLDDAMGLFEGLHRKHQNKRRVKIQLAPANLHWCSDKALTLLSDTSSRNDVLMHMHLLETAYQKEYAWRRGKCTALEYIDRFGMVKRQNVEPALAQTVEHAG